MRRLLLAATAVGLLAVGVSPGPDRRGAEPIHGPDVVALDAILADWHARPHGEPVRGAVLGLHSGRTKLFFGQPISGVLFALAPPNLRASVHLWPAETRDGRSYIRFVLTDGDGRPLPFRLDFDVYSGGVGHEERWFQIWPASESVGRFWKPGTYHLHAVIEKPYDPAVPHTIPGTFRSNELTFMVRESGAKPDAVELDAETVGRVQKLFRRGGVRTYGESGGDFWLWVAGLDERSSDRLREPFPWIPPEEWRTRAARYAPVSVPQHRPLTPAEADQLVADLGHPDPWVRMRAVVSAPRGAPAAVRAALVERLRDPYMVPTFGPGDPIDVPPIYLAAKEVITQLGAEMIDPLIALARRRAPIYYSSTVPELLGRIGPDPRSRDYLRELIQSGVFDDQYAAHKGVAAWGKDGVELLRELLTAPGANVTIRCNAIESLGRHGEPAVDGPTAHKLLAETEWNIQWSAAKAVGSLRYEEALPDLERIARDPAINFNSRKDAVDAALAVATPERGDRLLLELTDPKHWAVCGTVFARVGQRRLTAALPALLDAVESPDWYTRVTADAGLRGLAGLWEGVGYDPRKPDPKKWRDYWAARKP